MFGQRKCLVGNNVWSDKNFLSKKNKLLEKFLGPNKDLPKRYFGQTFFLIIFHLVGSK